MHDVDADAEDFKASPLSPPPPLSRSLSRSLSLSVFLPLPLFIRPYFSLSPFLPLFLSFSLSFPFSLSPSPSPPALPPLPLPLPSLSFSRLPSLTRAHRSRISGSPRALSAPGPEAGAAVPRPESIRLKTFCRRHPLAPLPPSFPRPIPLPSNPASASTHTGPHAAQLAPPTRAPARAFACAGVRELWSWELLRGRVWGLAVWRGGAGGGRGGAGRAAVQGPAVQGGAGPAGLLRGRARHP